MTYFKQTIYLILLAIFGVGNVMASEEAEYSVIRTQDNFEVRAYQAHILAETIVEGQFSSAGNKAFGRLFKYISGNNTARQNIQMTAPVVQTPEGEKIKMTSPVSQQQINETWAVSFMMPASYTLESLPEPKDATVLLRQVPAQQMAALRYSGSWNKKSYTRHKDELLAWMQKNDLQAQGEPIWARYNPPFTLWFLRRNEILIPIASASDN